MNSLLLWNDTRERLLITLTKPCLCNVHDCKFQDFVTIKTPCAHSTRKALTSPTRKHNTRTVKRGRLSTTKQTAQVLSLLLITDHTNTKLSFMFQFQPNKIGKLTYTHTQRVPKAQYTTLLHISLPLDMHPGRCYYKE
jgi:hypothetical protein